jgi:hypothetical protein
VSIRREVDPPPPRPADEDEELAVLDVEVESVDRRFVAAAGIVRVTCS